MTDKQIDRQTAQDDAVFLSNVAIMTVAIVASTVWYCVTLLAQ